MEINKKLTIRFSSEVYYEDIAIFVKRSEIKPIEGSNVWIAENVNSASNINPNYDVYGMFDENKVPTTDKLQVIIKHYSWKIERINESDIEILEVA